MDFLLISCYFFSRTTLKINNTQPLGTILKNKTKIFYTNNEKINQLFFLVGY